MGMPGNRHFLRGATDMVILVSRYNDWAKLLAGGQSV